MEQCFIIGSRNGRKKGTALRTITNVNNLKDRTRKLRSELTKLYWTSSLEYQNGWAYRPDWLAYGREEDTGHEGAQVWSQVKGGYLGVNHNSSQEKKSVYSANQTMQSFCGRKGFQKRKNCLSRELLVVLGTLRKEWDN